MNPVRPHLAADIDPVIGHAMHEFLKKPEIPLSLVQPVAVVGNMKHSAVNPDRTRGHAQEIRRRGVKIMRRAGEAYLMGEQLVFRLGPVRRFRIAHRIRNP